MSLKKLVMREDDVYKLVQAIMKKQNPEGMKVVDGLGEEDWTEVYSLIGCSIKKSFEAGFKVGQQMMGREKAIPIEWE